LFGGISSSWGDGFIDEFFESSKISLTFVALSFFVTFWIPFKGWVSSDLNTISLIDSSVEFGNNDISVILEGLTKLIPNWSKLFAVTAPWSVVFDENVLCWVHNDFLEFSSDNNNNVTLGLWDSSRFKMSFDRSIFNSVNEFTDLFNGDSVNISFESEFLHVSWKKSSDGWVVLLSNSHEFSEFTLDLVGRSSVGEKNLSLEGSGRFLENFLESSLVVFFLSEENEAILLLSENSLDLVLGESENGWDHEWFDVAKKGFFISGSRVDVNFLLELSEEDKGWLSGTEFGSASSIKVVDERNFFLGIRKFDVSFGIESIFEVGTEESNDEFISGGLFFKSITGKFSGSWSGFLEDP
jgi:hypothetical protein